MVKASAEASNVIVPTFTVSPPAIFTVALPPELKSASSGVVLFQVLPLHGTPDELVSSQSLLPPPLQVRVLACVTGVEISARTTARATARNNSEHCLLPATCRGRKPHDYRRADF